MLQEDGGKKIELKPGFLMEHDKDVCFNYLLLVILVDEFPMTTLVNDHNFL